MTDMLAKLDRKHLINILLIMIKRYPSERDKFIGTFQKLIESERPFPPRSVITYIIAAAKDHTGFISYYQTIDLTDELQEVLEFIHKADPSYEKLKTLLFSIKKRPGSSTATNAAKTQVGAWVYSLTVS